MSQEPPVLAQVVCPKCGAANYAHVQACWICHAELKGQIAEGNPYAVPGDGQAVTAATTAAPPAVSPAQSRVETVFLCLLVAIVVLAAFVGIGLGVQDSGLLTLYLIVIVPSLGAAGIRGLYSVAKGETPHPSKMFGTLIYSALITLGVGALLIVCTVIFLFMMCAQFLSGLGPR